ncbi:LacI family transcriptional regulator [Marivivens aquimaris]|uniref:LacI family transcriptional regulator n=1 Tax=Marivivens aquimaris TaxID=2774876 RepID=UPI00187F42C1|nr:LacI family transcriptional regulator [Marivivens aquimaris]
MTNEKTASGYVLEKGEKPTLKTIARLSGLAVPTVSRALSGAPDIGAATKKLVRRIADEIGYVPNRAGVRLRTGKTNVISLILAPESDMMNHTARLINAIAETLRGTQYHLIITHMFQDEDKLKPVRYIVETGSADAIIMNQTEPDDPRVAYLMEKKFPFATHGRTGSEKHAYFDFDNVEFGRIGVEELVRRGRKHLILIAPPQSQYYAKNTIEGASAAAEAAGVYLRTVRRTNSDESGEGVRAIVQNILEHEPEVDGIICSSPTAAMGSVAAAEQIGRAVGADIDIFGKEAVPFLKLFRKEIIVMPENVSQAGEFLARAVMQAINEPDLPPLQALEVPDPARLNK